MAENIFHINGRIIDQTEQGVEGLRIEAWDKDLFFDDSVGNAETDAEGFFEIPRFDEKYFKELIARRPDLYFKLFIGEESIPAQEFELTVTPPHGKPITGRGDSVFWKLAAGETKVLIRLAQPVASQVFKVNGTVLHPDGTPVAGATVKAFDKNIRAETLLGEVTTDKAGRYEITYHAETFLQSGKKRPDLIVRAFDQAGEEIACTAQPIYNAGQVEEVTLVVGNVEYKGPSEYEQLLGTLSPLLKDLELSELTDDDIDFLASKTGIASEQIVYLVLASRYAQKTELPREMFYGLFRQNLPTRLPALLAQNPDIQESALHAAVRDNIIPETISADQMLERFQQLVVDHAFEPLEPLPAGKTTLAELIGTVHVMNQEQQRKFVDLYVRHKGTIQNFWENLKKDPDLKSSVKDLQYTLQLGVLTGNHLPLVENIKQMESISCLRDLATLELGGWNGLIEAHGFPLDVPGKDDEEKIHNYAQTIFRMMEDAFPTTIIAHKLKEDTEFTTLSFREEISQFLLQTPEFEFGSTQIDTFFKENPHVFSKFATNNDQEGFIRQLKTMDRLFRISPHFERYEAMKVLVENGFNSAQSIAIIGLTSFTSQYAETLGNYWKAKAIYTNAAQMTATSLAVHTKYSFAYNQPGMYVLPDLAKKMQGIPDWRELFGPSKLCDCEHCCSVFSPAAYLVDHLHFLENYKDTTDGTTALEALFARRPDIGRFNLSCENTNTLVPYVDLVNEVLEEAVLPLTFTIDASDFPSSLNDCTIPDGLIKAFKDNGYSISNYAYITVQEKDEEWRILDRGWNYNIARSDTDKLEILVATQTGGTADALSANPEHLNPKAYDKLAQAIYPWHLPFDLWTAEARTYLNHLGVHKYQLMETFQRETGKPSPDDLEPDTLHIAGEYLGLTPKEQEIITDTSPSEQWRYWGLKAHDTIPDPTDPEKTITGNWNELLQYVTVFLEKSGLTYKELDELLNTRFINRRRFAQPYVPYTDIYVDFEDVFCNLEQAKLRNLHEDILGKIHRFIRLLRKIGWSARELDIALNVLISLVLSDPDIDKPFLLKLWHLKRLHKELKVPVIQLLSFWGLINTENYNGQVKSLYDHLFLNKTVLNPEDEIFLLNNQRDELENPNEQIIDHAAGVQAALEISDAELFLLLGLEWLFLIEWTIAAQTSLNNSELPQGWQQEFKAHGIELSENRDVSVVEEDRKWLLTDAELKFTIRNDEQQQKFHIYAHGESEVPDQLNLANLSHLYRIVTLSRALKLSLAEFLSIKKLTGVDPFLDPYDPKNLKVTVEFVKRAQKIRESEFSISELDYLLRHIYRESEGIAPREEEIARILGEIRDGLQKIAAENAYVPDPAGELIAMKLTWLKWDGSLIQNVIDTLKTSLEYETYLEALPSENFEFPPKFKDKIYYDADRKMLHWKGLMSGEEKFELLELSGKEEYQNAVKELFEKAKTAEAFKAFIGDRMKAFVLPPFSAELEEFPAGVVIPNEFKDKMYYDAGEKKLIFSGWMTEAEKATLFDLIPVECHEAINNLYDAPRNYQPEKENQFLTEDDILDLVDVSNITSRFDIILKKLLPYIQNAQSTNLVIQKIADTLKLEAKAAEQLLTHYVTIPAHYALGKKAIEILLSPDFAQSNPNVNITFKVFKEQFYAYILLHKIALIIIKLRVNIDDLPLLFQTNPDVWGNSGWADLNFLPFSTLEDPSALFSAAEKLFDLFSFRDILLPEKPTLFEILDMAFNPEQYRVEQVVKALSKRTGWKLEDLQHLKTWFGFELHDFRQVETLIKFKACFELIKRLGVSAGKICDWISAPEETAQAMEKAYQTARNIKQAAKAEYDNERWLEVAKPLRDDLREKQRSALVSYLIANYTFSGKTFKDSNDLYAHFLIDPEMAPCMMTSRLKLAISTVQLFIQRCLMNLDDWKIPNAKTAQQWSDEWQWRKNYRVWEANRKVFLYPENWIEPELRDDKSPFFKDLENELLQNEVTDENVEKVFLNYLEKLDAVARLEICGMYHEQESEAPNGLGKRPIDILHVFGRTKGTPCIYYYRRRIATDVETLYWTPWERVNLDIERDHLIPVVWNRRLYLFWPIFTEKAIKGGKQGEEPPKYWEIKMAWSEYRNEKWSAKEISSVFIEHSPKPEKVLFRTSIDSQNHLAIEVFDPVADFQPEMLFCLWGDLSQYKEELNNCHLSQELRAEFASNGHSLPSQAMVKVYWPNRKWLILYSGYVYIIQRIIQPYPNYAQDMEVSAHVSDMKVSAHVSDAFQFEGCRPDPIKKKVIHPVLYTAMGTEWYWMFLREIEESGENLYLPTPSDTPALRRTPGTFLLLPPSDGSYPWGHPFFFQDNTRTFFVTPRGTGVSDQPDIYDPNTPEFEWHNPDMVQVEDIDRDLSSYFESIWQYEHWEKMFPPTQVIDPFIVDETFSVVAPDEKTAKQIPDYGFYSTSTGAGARRLARSKASSLVTGNTATAMTSYSMATPVSEKTYLFETFYHPYVCEFVKHLNRDGIDGLLQRCVQMMEPLLFSTDCTAESQNSLNNGIFPEDLRQKFEAEQIRISDEISILVEEEGRRWVVDDNKNESIEAIIKKCGKSIKECKYTLKKEDNKLNIYIYELLFDNIYEPNNEVVDRSYPYENVDFEYNGAYSPYNWEIFFHAPLMIADRLSKNQQFAEAQKWFHYIFDPTDTSKYDLPQKYWKFRPFFEAVEEEPPKTLEDLLTKEQEELEKQVKEWQEDPFKPHLIARMRIMAYQKTVVMKYIDNLIAWGDQLFRRDTIESLNEATQLYILAAEILGKRPEDIPPHTEPPVKTFNDLKKEELDALSNAMVDQENYLSSPKSAKPMIRANDMQMFGPSFYLRCPAIALDGQQNEEMLYFCIPKNEKLLSYWDTVADRLFKIRHCMNIEGVVRQLPLFQPPIEPGLLVRAAAAGVDISSAISDLNAPLPHYRFQYMLQKAIELCAEVRSFGASLLSALEKKDAEKLALLRSSHEVDLLKAIEDIKKKQLDEAIATKESQEQAKNMVKIKTKYYQQKLGLENKPAAGDIPEAEKLNLIPQEKEQLKQLEAANERQIRAMSYELAAQIYSLYPDITLGTSGMASPVVTAQIGGSLYATGVRAFAAYENSESAKYSYASNQAAIMANHHRTAQDMSLNLALPVQEEEQIDKLILAADIRKASAEKDLENHQMQIENAEEVNTFMKDKFTNQELYHWMVSQLSTLYFQSYQMAYDLAKRAEKAFRHELADYDTTFVNFGYWDNLKKGLLAGEQLFYDLKRMETAYLDQNKREYEITRHISLAMLDPVALINLKENNECFVSLPEALFDLDYPGHYMRRIKSVSLTIPCVTGPYTSVNCTLTLLGNRIRNDTSTDGEYGGYDYQGIEDRRFQHNIGAIQSIATSNAQNDSGMFELNFHDERYLPFEGAGVISEWRLELPNKFRQFDYDTISDVVFHINYTAREGGGSLKEKVEENLKDALNMMVLGENGKRKGLFRMFSARHDFSNEWFRFFQLVEEEVQEEEQEDATTIYKHKLHMDLSTERFPFPFRQKKITLTGMMLLMKLKDEIQYDQSLAYDLKKGDVSQIQADNQKRNEFTVYEIPEKLVILSAQPFTDQAKELTQQEDWIFEVNNTDIPSSLRHTENGAQPRLNPDVIEDMWIVVQYSVPEPSE